MKDLIYRKALGQRLEHIQRYLCGLANQYNWCEIDLALNEIIEDFEYYDTQEIIIYLMCTKSIKDHLQNRTTLCRIARNIWEVEHPKEVDGLLMGLE